MIKQLMVKTQSLLTLVGFLNCFVDSDVAFSVLVSSRVPLAIRFNRESGKVDFLFPITALSSQREPTQRFSQNHRQLYIRYPGYETQYSGFDTPRC